jgi:hypothetical protein
VNRADPGAGEHGDRRFGDHRHVDDDPVPARHALRGQRAREQRHRVAQLAIGEDRDGLRHRRVVDQRRLVAPPGLDVAVEGVVARVQAAAREPAVERGAGVVEHPLPRLDPVDRGGGLCPKILRLIQRAPVHLGESTHGESSLLRAC